MKKTGKVLSVVLSLATAVFAVYMVIIMIAPELYNSILSLWKTLPEKINVFLEWAQLVFSRDSVTLRASSSYDDMLAFGGVIGELSLREKKPPPSLQPGRHCPWSWPPV